MMKTNPAAVYLTAMLLAALASSCSEAPPILPTGSTGSGGSGGMATSSSSSSSGEGGSGGGTGGAGGAGGGSVTPAPAHAGTEIVNGGQFMKSDKYSMVYTIGQPSQVQSTVKSDKYRMQGGIVGATGSLP